MSEPADVRTLPLAEVYARALDARDPRFDGVFFVGITTTRIYCRPTCPARVSRRERRRFFATAAAAERAGYRPCLRCRPELAPGRAVVDAVPRLVRDAAHRIAAGALNGRAVADLARDLGVSERHLRRALEREIGVSPLELALTHRLLLAKRLLADTRLPVTRIAFASGFQSLRRFNAAFRERYRMCPSELRRGPGRRDDGDGPSGNLVRLTLSYRPPLAWDALLELLRRDAVRGVDAVEESRYARTVRLHGHTGVVVVEHGLEGARGAAPHHVRVELSPGLLPVLMPLLARLRQLLDLDAEPSVIDAQLAAAGLGEAVRARPGVRVPGAVDGFEVALRTLLRRAAPGGAPDVAWRVTHALGDPIDAGVPGLHRLAPDARRVADAGVDALVALGACERESASLVALAGAVAAGDVRLAPGADPHATRRALRALGVDDGVATYVVMRALGWPDAFPADDSRALHARAERWRPWRAYAAVHLWLRDRDAPRASAARAG